MAGMLDYKLFAPEALNKVKGSLKKCFDAFRLKVEALFNTKVWDSVFAPTHWQLPAVDENKKKLLPLRLDNKCCKAAIQSIDTVIHFLFTDTNQPERYKECILLFRQLFIKLRKKTPFSDNDIVGFQRTTDEWFQRWMDLEGWEGCTNSHMLGSGHIPNLLFHHRNLYIFLNQGWEALNSLIKQVYFRWTARGGGRNMTSRLLPTARWLQRQLVFMAVDDEQDMIKKLEELRKENNEANNEMVSNKGDDVAEHEVTSQVAFKDNNDDDEFGGLLWV
jgi:hypothetical protein